MEQPVLGAALPAGRRLRESYYSNGHRRGFLLAIAIWLLTCINPACADTPTVAVFYPEVEGAFARVFADIIEGIRKTSGLRISTRGLPKDPDNADLRDWLEAESAHSIIALGDHSYRTALALNLKLPVVVGASLLPPDGVRGISLAVDPAKFFERFGSLTPPVKRVFLVYSEKNSGWLIPYAKRAALAQGVELHSYPARDTRDAVRFYRDILDQANGPEDAIWLPLDNIAPYKTILPSVLEAAWNRRLVVFSNNPSHVRKGVLFSLFPDHQSMGQRLAGMALKAVRSPDGKREVLPLRDLKLAVNLRTASHLGLSYSSAMQRDFALIFPSR